MEDNVIESPVPKRRRVSRIVSQAALQSYGSTSSNASTQRIPRQRRPRNTQRMTPASIGNELPSAPLQLSPQDACRHCAAERFEFESNTFCCGNGSIELISNEYPPELVRLYTSNDEDAVHFRKYARLYNNLFAYSSLGGNTEAGAQKGIYVFKLHGQIYHHVPNLLPDSGKPKYLQLYFYDGEHEALNRTGCFPELRKDVVDILIEISRENPYAQFFRSLKEMDVQDTTQIRINKSAVLDQRTFNAPTSDEVAVIWTESSSSSDSASPHITVCGKSDEMHRIMHYYGCYDPLQYPFLFPCGECGWHKGILKKTHVANVELGIEEDALMPENDEILGGGSTCLGLSDDQEDPVVASPMQPAEELLRAEGDFQASVYQADPVAITGMQSAEELLAAEAHCASQQKQKKVKHVSCREYYAYKLQNRPNNMLLKAGRCFQQYIVDMYVKVENTRLDFYRYNQETIRAELYQGLVDTVLSGESIAANVGRRVILPATFLGGPRDMKRRYLNAMALVQKYGKPDLFITMTCNTNWLEIQQALEPGELAQNRPDLVSRVFRAKLLALKRLIKKKAIFGEVAAMIYVVEFQKRGLPHAHFLIILKPDFKIKCPADFDKYVCAEIPSRENPVLRSLVLKHMMHGPCGHLNPECRCMKHRRSIGRCKYGFPKKFTNDTTNSEDGYPVYRRRNTGESATVRRFPLNNLWVIPYNPYLLSLFDCHLNVEICSSIQAVKYLYKYVYKGHDKISFNLASEASAEVINEIDQYISGRWVSPCEAAWRLYGFDLFEMHPAVMPLQIHLENMQPMQVIADENLHDVIADERRVRTPLTEYFRLNAKLGGSGYLYSELTEHYRWDTSKKNGSRGGQKRLSSGGSIL